MLELIFPTVEAVGQEINRLGEALKSADWKGEIRRQEQLVETQRDHTTIRALKEQHNALSALSRRKSEIEGWFTPYNLGMRGFAIASMRESILECTNVGPRTAATTSSPTEDYALSGNKRTLRRGKDGFTSFVDGDDQYTLTESQGCIMERLWSAAKDKTRTVKKKTLLRAAGRPTTPQPMHVFRTGNPQHMAFFKKFIKHDNAGNYWLDLD